MTLKIRHALATTGRMPLDPAGEPASGVVGAALGISTIQAGAGYSVEVWGWNDRKSARDAEWEGVKLWTSPQWTWARLARWDVRWPAPIWWRALAQPPVDVLHAHVDPNLLYTPGARVRLLHLQTPVPEPFPPAYRRLLRRADAVICCSDFIRTRFLAASGYAPARTFVVHNGANPSAYRPSEGQEMRTAWGLGESDSVILYTGAIIPEKGVAQLVRAFALVQPALSNVTLIIVGGAHLWALRERGQSGEAYEAEVRRLAEGLKVHFTGILPRDQMPAAMAAADIVVAPSVWDDPHPTVVCEAMAAGRPVIASRAGGITETVRHGETGLLVSPGDEAELAEAIKTLATQADLRREMSHAARERSRAFTWEASAQRLENIYHELLGVHEKAPTLEQDGER